MRFYLTPVAQFGDSKADGPREYHAEPWKSTPGPNRKTCRNVAWVPLVVPVGRRHANGGEGPSEPVAFSTTVPETALSPREQDASASAITGNGTVPISGPRNL